MSINSFCHYFFIKQIYIPSQKKSVIFIYISGNIFLFNLFFISDEINWNLTIKESLYIIFIISILFLIFLINYIG